MAASLGDHVVIQANSTIGSVGFGYAFIDGAHRLIPHNGGVVIEDTDAAAAQLDAQRVEESMERVLGSGVAAARGDAGQAGEARDDDDLTTVLAQQRQSGAREPDAAEVVDPHQAFEDRAVGEILDARPHRDAGVEEQDIEPAEARRAALDDARAVALLADVARDDLRLGAQGFASGPDFLEPVAIACDERQPGAPRRRAEAPGPGRCRRRRR